MYGSLEGGNELALAKTVALSVMSVMSVRPPAYCIRGWNHCGSKNPMYGYPCEFIVVPVTADWFANPPKYYQHT